MPKTAPKSKTGTKAIPNPPAMAPGASVTAASFMMGTAGMPLGLDPANSKKANPWGAYGTPASAGIGSQDVRGGGLDQQELVRRSNFWRDNYNPLRGLTIARLMALFEQAERGAFSEIQLTLRKAEKRFPVLKGFIEKMLSSIEELEGKVRIKEQLPDGATPAMAEAQRKFLQGRYDLLRNFKSSVAQIALADIRGYAVLQKHRCSDGGPNDGAVEELYWLEPWCWVRDGFYGDFYYNENSQFGVGLGSCAATLGENNRIGSEAMPREDFVIRESDSPMYEIALIAFVNWLMGRKDYAAFTEIFGLPNSVVIMPPNIAIGKEQDYQAAAEQVSRGANGALPNGADVKFPTAAVRGESPFKPFCDEQEKDLVLAGTGGTLTMISSPTGLGKGASEEHDAAWTKIAVNKGRRVNEVLQRDFDAPELAAKFPKEPVCVEFALDVRDSEDVGAMLDNAVKLESLGLQTDLNEISERSGFKLSKMPVPEPGADPNNPNPDDPLAGLAQKAALRVGKSEISAAVKNRLVKLLNRAGANDAEKIYQALETELKPLHDRLAAVARISDPALRKQKLQGVQDDMDQIIRDITTDPSELVNALAALNATSLREGLSDNPIANRGGRVLNFAQDQPRDSLGKWVDANGGGLSQKENIQRGNKAMDRAIRKKADVQKAMYRKGIGQIDFPHGTPGDKANDFAGGHGVSHIVAKHGEADARALPEVLAKGKISVNPRDPETKRLIVHGNYEASLVKENTRKAWLLTGFRKQVAG